MNRIIRFKNVSGTEGTWASSIIAPDAYYELTTDSELQKWQENGKVFADVAAGNLLVGNENEWYEDKNFAWNTWVLGVFDIPVKNSDGRVINHTTPRPMGTFTYFTGSDDDHVDPHAVGGVVNVNELDWHHQIGDAMTDSRYFDFNTIINTTYIRQGNLIFKNAELDYLDFEVVPKVTTYTLEENTNFNLYSGYLIIPAAGDGTVQVANEDMILVQNVPNEFGVRPAGYWDADWSTTTKQFENIAPNVNGTGNYNMFGLEIILHRFMNRKKLLGNGLEICETEDVAPLGHNIRLKITTTTQNPDHEWSVAATLMLYRNRTV